MILPQLAWASLKNRKVATFVTVFSVALSVFLVIGVERIRRGTEDSFSNTLSQTDLIVGARGSELQLLLYSVFHLGDATNNISFDSYKYFRDHPAVDWTIPISLGDSHEGYRVVATDHNFFDHYRFQEDQSLKFKSGTMGSGVFDVVLGSDVARHLGYRVGSPIVITHGISTLSLSKHDDKPFKVSGILNATGTAVDRALYISLEGMEAIHIDWKNGAPPTPGDEVPQSKITKDKIKIGQITSFLMRSKSRIMTLRLQREISTYEREPLMAAIPGVVLAKLWDTMAYADVGLRAISGCVALVSLLGLLLVMYTALNERRREMAILRALGAGPFRLLGLLIFEALGTVIIGITTGLGALYLLLALGRSWLVEEFGLYVPVQSPSVIELATLGAFAVAAGLIGLTMAVVSYRRSLVDGLSVKL